MVKFFVYMVLAMFSYDFLVFVCMCIYDLRHIRKSSRDIFFDTVVYECFSVSGCSG